MKRIAFLLLFLLAARSSRADGVLAREGKGYLERRGGLLVLHVKGSPYEMGYQHGKLLRSHVRALMRVLLDEFAGQTFKLSSSGPEVRVREFLRVLFQAQRPFYRKRFIQEMKGLADGAGIPLQRVFVANHLPELFHCSGFALIGRATVGGEVLHGRVLDYMTDAHLQDHAVLIVAEPEGFNAFVNVGFAGFIGSVTGINDHHVAIGEMGGGGQLFWAGEPMSFLVRRVLEEADSVEKAVSIFRSSPRTCEYYYVISDGLRKKAVGLATTWQDIFIVKPGSYHPLLPEPVPDCVILSADERYRELVKRIRKSYGSFTPKLAIRLMDAPVAMKHNLHNALMVPRTGDLWAAYAAPDGSPAWKQTYVHVNLFELLGRKPLPAGTETSTCTRASTTGPAE